MLYMRFFRKLVIGLLLAGVERVYRLNDSSAVLTVGNVRLLTSYVLAEFVDLAYESKAVVGIGNLGPYLFSLAPYLKFRGGGELQRSLGKVVVCLVYYVAVSREGYSSRYAVIKFCKDLRVSLYVSVVYAVCVGGVDEGAPVT